MYKKIIGIICIIIGCALLYFGYDISKQLAEAKSKIAKSKSLFPTNPLTSQIEKGIKEEYYKEVDSYQIYVTLCYIGGGVFIFAGGIIFILGFRKKR